MFLHVHYLNEQIEETVYEEWDIFVIQFRKEVQLHQVQRVEPNRLSLLNQQGQSIVFSSYGNLLRRQVNGAGHEVYLTGVNELTFNVIDQLIYLEVIFLDGTYKKAQFIDRTTFTIREYHAPGPHYVLYNYFDATPISNNKLSSNQSL